MYDLHPMMIDPRLAHLNFTAFAEPDGVWVTKAFVGPPSGVWFSVQIASA